MAATGMLLWSGCVVTEDGASAPSRMVTERPTVERASEVPPPALDPDIDGGTDARRPLSVVTWNLEWFADADAGPTDDATQYADVRAILRALGKNLVALEEVASVDAFERLNAELTRYASVLSGYDWTQKTALLWDATRFGLVRSYALAGLEDAGRPPLVVELRDLRDGRALIAVVVHAKAQEDQASYDKRAAFASGLKAELDRRYPAQPLILLGDFNDSLIDSIDEGQPSPYRAFTEDPAYATPTAILDRATQRESSYATGPTIDHIIVSDELGSRVDSTSVEVLRDELLAQYPSYLKTVSDHFPVTLSIAW